MLIVEPSALMQLLAGLSGNLLSVFEMGQNQYKLSKPQSILKVSRCNMA